MCRKLVERVDVERVLRTARLGSKKLLDAVDRALDVLPDELIAELLSVPRAASVPRQLTLEERELRKLAGEPDVRHLLREADDLGLDGMKTNHGGTKGKYMSFRGDRLPEIGSDRRRGRLASPIVEPVT